MSGNVVQWDATAYASLEAVLRERAGLVFQALRRPTVEAAALRVMRRIGLESPDAFVSVIREDGAVFDDVMAEVTIGETYFFRESSHFALLREVIIPAFRRHARDRAMRVWSAGCSTGEEPYSLAIALREAGVRRDVVGTDVSRARLATARRGEYRRWSFRGVPESVIDRYFRRTGEQFVLAPEIRREVDFRYLNLASDCYPAMSSGVWGMDVIFCRNVLIYFDAATVARVAASLLASLADEGWILLGATDPPLNDYVDCHVVQTSAGLAYRKRPATSGPALFVTSAIRAPRPTPPAVSLVPPPLPVVPPEPRQLEEATSGIARAIHSEPQTVEPAAETAYKHRDYDRTIALVAPAAENGSASVSDLVVYVRALANTGRLEEAGRACATALDRHRQHAELHYLHAVLVGQTGRHAESARAAKRALYLDREMIVAHLCLATALVRTDDLAGASRAFAAAERLLGSMVPDAIVPYSDGEPAGRLLEMTRTQAKLVTRGVTE